MSGLDCLPSDARDTVVTVGTFDGVHLGHRRVLEEIAVRARRAGRRSVLVTFEPHPMEVVNPDAAPQLLTLGDERREILAQSELDVVAFLPFTRVLSRYPPDAFVRLLIDRFGLKELVIGHDHGFGRGRAGGVQLVRQLGSQLGFEVDVVDAVVVHGRSVSSTFARRAIAGGDLRAAIECLGRPYSMTSVVMRGAGRGHEIGYPTVNLQAPDRRKLLPPDGVYAVRVQWASGSAGGMMHQGPRPTFREEARSLEVHLFDTNEDLYGASLKLEWIGRLRDITAFPTPKALKDQLDRDARSARNALTQYDFRASH